MGLEPRRVAWPGILGNIQLTGNGGSAGGYPAGCERQGRSLRKSLLEESPERKHMVPMPKKHSSRRSDHYSGQFHLMTI